VRSVVIVGCGFIGVELALLLSDLGVTVTVLGRRGWVMPRMLDPDTAAVAERAIRARGVDLRLGVAAAAFVGDDTVAGVEMADGTVLTADAYVAATGVKPHVEYLGGSGIGVDWGVHVDDRMRTDAPDVYAAGDVAEAADRMTGERYVHATFPNAVSQGEVVAHNILDPRLPDSLLVTPVPGTPAAGLPRAAGRAPDGRPGRPGVAGPVRRLPGDGPGHPRSGDRRLLLDRPLRDGSIRCPVLVVAGRGDPLSPLGYTRQVFDEIVAPAKELLVVETDVHLLFVEALEATLPPLLQRLRALTAPVSRPTSPAPGA